MRTFELSTRITAIGRSEGRSATSAVAYRACCAIHCEREDRVHDYTRKQGLEVSGIVVPQGAPDWASNRAALWNAAEMRERNGKRGPNAGKFKADAKVAREFMFAFPVELSLAGRLKVAESVARHLAGTHGIVADFSIHRPGKDGDERNFHCHMLTTTRRMTADGLAAKAREWDALKSGAMLSKQFRALLAATMNDALAEEGQAGAVHVEHRSFKARGDSQRPQKHLGPNRTNAIRRELRERRTTLHASQSQQQRERHSLERDALAARQDSALARKLADLAARERRGLAAIEATGRTAAAAQPVTGLRRLFQAAGSREHGSLSNREANGADRGHAIDGQLATLKREIQAERTAYIAGQAHDRQALADRHANEDRQLVAAVTHRVTHDRLIERQERQSQHLIEHDQQRHDTEHGHDRSRSP